MRKDVSSSRAPTILGTTGGWDSMGHIHSVHGAHVRSRGQAYRDDLHRRYPHLSFFPFLQTHPGVVMDARPKNTHDAQGRLLGAFFSLLRSAVSSPHELSKQGRRKRRVLGS